jgi:hypothetical protein
MASPVVDYRSLMTPDSIVIYHSRKKLLLVSAGAAIFIALGVFLLTTGKVEDRIAGIAGIVIFGLCLLVVIWQLTRQVPAIIIHYSGILYNPSRATSGFLRWDEIAGIFISRLRTQRFLSIAVKDMDGFLSRRSSLKANLLKINMGLVGAPINISATTLPISLEELIQNIQQKCPNIAILSRDA